MLLAPSIKFVSQANATVGGVPVPLDILVVHHAPKILIVQVEIARETGGRLVPPLVVKESVVKRPDFAEIFF